MKYKIENNKTSYRRVESCLVTRPRRTVESSCGYTQS